MVGFATHCDNLGALSEAVTRITEKHVSLDVRPEQYDELKCGSYEQFDSKCDETMVGLKFNEDKMIQCWVGYQTEPLVE